MRISTCATSSWPQSPKRPTVLAEVTILDVGHGNSAVGRSHACCAVIDAGTESPLLEFLASEEITHIDLVIVSHADLDHLAGVTQLLVQDHIAVDRVMVNPDTKPSDEWRRFRSGVRD